MKIKDIKKINIMLFIIIILNNSITFAYNRNTIEPMVRRCEYFTSYSDRVDTTSKKNNFLIL